jgi:hypothetical protein
LTALTVPHELLVPQVRKDVVPLIHFHMKEMSKSEGSQKNVLFLLRSMSEGRKRQNNKGKQMLVVVTVIKACSS